MERMRGAMDELKIIGEVRGRGLMIGIELVEDRDTKEPLAGEKIGQIVMGLLGRGVIMVPCGRHGNVLRLMPALTITRDYMETATNILLEVLREI